MTDPKPEHNGTRLVVCAVNIIVLWILSQGLDSDGWDYLHLLQAGQQRSVRIRAYNLRHLCRLQMQNAYL